MKNQNATKAMKAAWTNSRKAAAKFGGKPSQYFAEALRQAWAWVKSEVDNWLALGEIVRETAKAVMVDVGLDTFQGYVKASVWFPKSQIKNNKVPKWLHQEKVAELQRKYKLVYLIEWF